MRQKLRSHRYFRQIFILTVSVFLALSAVFIIQLYSGAKRDYARTIANAEKDRTANLLYQSDIYWKQLASIGFSFFNTSILPESLDVSSNYRTRFLYEQILSSHLLTYPYIENIEYENNGASISPSSTLHENNLGSVSIFQIYTEETSAWPYKFDLFTNPTHSVGHSVTLTIKAYHMSQQLFSSSNSDRLDYLLTPQGTVLLANDRSSFFRNIDQIHPGLLECLSEYSDTTLSVYNTYYLVLSQPDSYGFSALSLIPKDLYSHQYHTLILQTLLMGIFFLMLAILISLLLSIRLYRPVKSMVNLIQIYVPDNIRAYENEISFIQQNISKYFTTEKKAREQMPQTITQLHNAQAAVLQHQINSHFLFNTLENIKAISIMELGMDNEIENSIMLLNQLIHENIFQKTTLVSLSHELHLSKCYVELMQLRFPDVQTQWEIDETLLPCMVLRFSLQPVLENCFSHAFKGSTGRQNQISIRIFREETDTLLISIQDNGQGLDSVSIQKLQWKLLSEEEIGTSHIGIHNIQKRITTVFGPDFGITIQNAAPGITVEIRYPLTLPPQVP